MEMKRLMPVAGKVVRDPDTGQPLPAHGAIKPMTSYWLNRIREGGCKVDDLPASNKGSKKRPAKQEAQ